MVPPVEVAAGSLPGVEGGISASRPSEGHATQNARLRSSALCVPMSQKLPKRSQSTIASGNRYRLNIAKRFGKRRSQSKETMKNTQLAKAFAAVLVLGAGWSATASITMTFTWTGSLWQDGYTANLNTGTYNGQVIQSDDAIGIYAFDVAQNPAPSPSAPNPLYSVCLSPAGLLDGGTYTYTAEPFNTATPGIYPSQWAVGTGGQPYGINNAAYLWSTYGSGILSAQDSTAAAALEFAIWTALYDSTGYGKLGNSYFTINSLGGDTLTDYNKYLSGLTTSGFSGGFTGDILEGTGAVAGGADSGQSQEFFLLQPASQLTPVPEPSTVVAGAMMLLPFGVSAVRIVRRNRGV